MVLKITNLHILRYLPTCWLYLLERYAIDNQRCTHTASKNEPTQNLNHAIEQVRSWERYFDENPHEKGKIFGAVARFRYILVAGSKEEWQEENHAKWRIHHNKNSNIEIHSSDILLRPLRLFEEHPEEFWSFAEHPYTQAPSQLQLFWKEYDYMDNWRKIL